jgi:stage IV sporulation protein FB
MIEFRFFGIPVQIQPWFWLILALLGYGFGGMLDNKALGVALFVMAGAISIFVHELGHAFAGRYFGAKPHIVLQSFGGYAAFPGSYFSRLQNFLVTAAGPAAQLCLWLLATVVLKYVPMPSAPISLFFGAMATVSLFWALLNLIPVYPLDGGQMLFSVLGPQQHKLALKISIGVAVIVAVYSVVSGFGIFLPIFMGMYAFQNFQELQQQR